MADSDHLRQQIRDAVVTALTGLSGTGSNVFPSRVHPAEESRLPCILIYTRRERSEISIPEDAGEKTYRRSLTLMVEVVARGSDVDDRLDAQALLIEAALEADTTLGGLCWDLELQETQISGSDENSRYEFGALRLIYQIVYHTSAGDPSTLSGG